MGITTVLETEDGKHLAVVQDPRNVLHGLLPAVDNPGYVYLSCIDRYGDTVFNHLQIPRFLAEWQTLEIDKRDSEVVTLFDSVQRLAESLLEQRHVYLKFYGD